jgi:hypothetical protein
MLRAFATWFAKWRYRWNKEVEAGMHTWSARVAEQNAKASRDLIVKLKNEADAYEARIKQVAEMEEKGFWLCENGHEDTGCSCSNPMLATPGTIFPAIVHTAGCRFGDDPVKCAECGKSMKPIKRSEMTGQEQYESDKDRKDAEKLLAARRQEITEKETDAGQQEATAKYFRTQAESGRKLADSLREI